MTFVCRFYLLNNFKILHRITRFRARAREREARNSKHRRNAAAKRNFEYVPFTVFRERVNKRIHKKRKKELHNKRSKRVNWRRQLVMECNGISQNTLLFSSLNESKLNRMHSFSPPAHTAHPQCFVQNGSRWRSSANFSVIISQRKELDERSEFIVIMTDDHIMIDHNIKIKQQKQKPQEMMNFVAMLSGCSNLSIVSIDRIASSVLSKKKEENRCCIWICASINFSHWCFLTSPQTEIQIFVFVSISISFRTSEAKLQLFS